VAGAARIQPPPTEWHKPNLLFFSTRFRSLILDPLSWSSTQLDSSSVPFYFYIFYIYFPSSPIRPYHGGRRGRAATNRPMVPGHIKARADEPSSLHSIPPPETHFTTHSCPTNDLYHARRRIPHRTIFPLLLLLLLLLRRLGRLCPGHVIAHHLSPSLDTVYYLHPYTRRTRD
jgi:hypothetical protein